MPADYHLDVLIVIPERPFREKGRKANKDRLVEQCHGAAVEACKHAGVPVRDRIYLTLATGVQAHICPPYVHVDWRIYVDFRRLSDEEQAAMTKRMHEAFEECLWRNVVEVAELVPMHIRLHGGIHPVDKLLVRER